MSTQLSINFSQRSQSENILRHLKSGKSITSLDALREFGCFRLGARIWEIKKSGLKVESKMIDVGNGKHVAEYSLSKEAKENYESS